MKFMPKESESDNRRLKRKEKEALFSEIQILTLNILKI